MKKYRDNGAIGALLDEYEKAITELREVIQTVSQQELTVIVDKTTKDLDCISIQTILRHVVRAGYNYVIEIRKHLGEQLEFAQPTLLQTIDQYQKALITMFHYNEKLFEDYPNITLEETEEQNKIKAKWGQSFDVEQLLEHAIVHILRHRRQIERFLIKLRD